MRVLEMCLRDNFSQVRVGLSTRVSHSQRLVRRPISHNEPKNII